MLIFYSVVQVKKYIKFLEKTKKNCEDVLLSDKFKISHLKHLDSFYPVGDEDFMYTCTLNKVNLGFF